MRRSYELETNVRRELETLVSDLIDGRLDEPGRERLNFMLRDSQACRVHFNALMDLQCGMLELLQQADIESISNTQVIAAPASIQNGASNQTASGPNHWNKLAIGIASLAAGLLIAVMILRPSSQSKQLASVDAISDSSSHQHPKEQSNPSLSKEDPNRLVRVRQASAAEYFDGGPAVVGQVAEFDREYVLNAGLVMLAFPNGAETIVEGPSVFTVVSPDRLLVKQGRCSVHAPDGAEGFRVDTPQTQVIDLGTRFSVDVNEVGRTDVQVIDGAAEVLSTLGQSPSKKLLLQEGEAYSFGEDLVGVSQPIEFESSAYRSNLPDRIVRYECEESVSPVSNLKQVTVQRGGELIDYSVDELIGVRLVHYVADKNVRSVATVANAGPLVRDLLESDRSLVTGVINPGGSAIALKSDPVLQGDSASEGRPLTPGIGFRFQQPVINGPGPDVVLFELHSKVNLPNGDGFHVSPVAFKPGLRSHTIKRYDITLKAVESMPLRTFVLPTFSQNGNLLDFKVSDGMGDLPPTLPFYSTAVGIDLSDLGYEIGGSIEGLFLQDDMDENRQFDPVFIGGLPAANTIPDNSNAAIPNTVNQPKASAQ
jgi:hypothetical protein